ncbi:L-aspartate oxidase [Niallia sp. XMNu-256]|uniref:L-aspartate oxidase n=1 Tax=Niallia sp. XMNu-256 TaxID=3082444 RepID=UPI0030CF200C
MKANVIIIGSGIAALKLAKMLRRDLNVIIFTKSNKTTSNSYLAQGGIAVALSDNDDPYKHYQDTLEAGRYYNNEEIVAKMTKEAPGLIKELLSEGAPFDRDSSGNIKLGLEGAHGEKRIIHGGGDATGKTIVDFLLTQTQHIQIAENMTVYDLMIENERCIGVKAKDSNERTYTVHADHVVIATGGIGQVYSFTSNADTVTGDGIALAYRAGADLADMEFVQFHPTLLYAGGKGVGLVSEAVRGEGARLVTEDGTHIMEGVHPYKDLAPRHVVSQTIYQTMSKGKSVYLDISSIKNFQSYFPTVASLCRDHGIDINKGKIPVVPGSHFLMGGILTNLHGQTSVPGLYAIGEAACTGAHGANRLASNSLLEGLYFGKRLAQWINEAPVTNQIETIARKPKKQIFAHFELPDIATIKKTMMDSTGISRNGETLETQLKYLESYHIDYWLHADLDDLSLEDLNKVFMLICSWLVTKAALKRTESRGGHLRADFPVEDEGWAKRKIILQKKGDRVEQIKVKITT